MKDSQRVLRHVAIFRRKVDYKDGKIQKFNCPFMGQFLSIRENKKNTVLIVKSKANQKKRM